MNDTLKFLLNHYYPDFIFSEENLEEFDWFEFYDKLSKEKPIHYEENYEDIWKEEISVIQINGRYFRFIVEYEKEGQHYEIISSSESVAKSIKEVFPRQKTITIYE